MSDPSITHVKSDEETHPGTSRNTPSTHEFTSQTGRGIHIKQEPLVTQRLSTKHNILKRRQSLVYKKTNKRQKLYTEPFKSHNSLINHELLAGQHPIINENILVLCMMRDDPDPSAEQAPTTRVASVTLADEPVDWEETTFIDGNRVRHEIHITLNQPPTSLDESMTLPIVASTTSIVKETRQVEISNNENNRLILISEANQDTIIPPVSTDHQNTNIQASVDNRENEVSVNENLIENQPPLQPTIDRSHSEFASTVQLVLERNTIESGIIRSQEADNVSLLSHTTIITEDLENELIPKGTSTPIDYNESPVANDPMLLFRQPPIEDVLNAVITEEPNLEDSIVQNREHESDRDQESIVYEQSVSAIMKEAALEQDLIDEEVLINRPENNENIEPEPIPEQRTTLNDSLENQEPLATPMIRVADVPYETSPNFYIHQDTSLADDNQHISLESIISCGGTTTRSIPYPSNFRCLSGTVAPYSIIRKESAADMPGPSTRPPMKCTCPHKPVKQNAHSCHPPSLTQTTSASTCQSRNKSSTDDFITCPRMPQAPICPRPMIPTIPKRCQAQKTSSTVCCQQQEQMYRPQQCNKPRGRSCCDEEFFSLSSDSSETDVCAAPKWKQKTKSPTTNYKPCVSNTNNYQSCASDSNNYQPCASNSNNYQPCASNSNNYQPCASNSTTYQPCASNMTTASMRPCTEPRPPCSSNASDRDSTCRQAAIVQLLKELVQLVEGNEPSESTAPCDTSYDNAACAPSPSKGILSEGDNICNISDLDQSAFNAEDICFNSTQLKPIDPEQCCFNTPMPCSVLVSTNIQNGPAPFCLMPVNDQPGLYELTRVPDCDVPNKCIPPIAMPTFAPNAIVCEPDFIDDGSCKPSPECANEGLAWAPVPGQMDNDRNTATSITTCTEEEDEMCDEQEDECKSKLFAKRAVCPRPHVKQSDDGECTCCHCRAMRNNKNGTCPAGNGPAAMGTDDASNLMRYFIDSIILDLESMEHARNKKQFEQSVCKPTSFPRQSFPVTITEVTDLGASSLYVKWTIHDCYGIGGYEIYVDGYLTNRYFNANHEAAVVCEMDVSRPHKIVLMAVPRIEEDDETGKMLNICKTLIRPSDINKQQPSSNSDRSGSSCKTPNNNVCPKAPANLWVPSIYLYDPSCRLSSSPIMRKS